MTAVSLFGFNTIILGVIIVVVRAFVYSICARKQQKRIRTANATLCRVKELMK